MKKRIINFTTSLIFLATCLGGIHFLSLRLIPEQYHVQHIYEMHIFLFLLTLVVYVLLTFLLNKKRYLMGYGFMVTSILKMGLSILFLLPQIVNKTSTTKSYVIQFFILYFCYLIFEVIILAKDLKRKNEEDKEPAPENSEQAS